MHICCELKLQSVIAGVSRVQYEYHDYKVVRNFIMHVMVLLSRRLSFVERWYLPYILSFPKKWGWSRNCFSPVRLEESEPTHGSGMCGELMLLRRNIRSAEQRRCGSRTWSDMRRRRRGLIHRRWDHVIYSFWGPILPRHTGDTDSSLGTSGINGIWPYYAQPYKGRGDIRVPYASETQSSSVCKNVCLNRIMMYCTQCVVKWALPPELESVSGCDHREMGPRRKICEIQTLWEMKIQKK